MSELSAAKSGQRYGRAVRITRAIRGKALQPCLEHSSLVSGAGRAHDRYLGLQVFYLLFVSSLNLRFHSLHRL